MNGSYGGLANHTLSPKQAQDLINNINEKGIRFIRNIESSTNQFLEGVSKIWADDNAVSVAKEVSKSAAVIVDLYGGKSCRLKDEIVDLCRKYSQAGGFSTSSINNPYVDETININTNVVKDTFDGDRYGFEDNSSVRGVYDSLSGLKKQLNELGSQLSSDLQKTNAFGNTDVKVLLARCASDITTGIDSELDKFINYAYTQVNDAKAKYVKVSGAIGGSNFSSESVGSLSLSKSDSAGETDSSTEVTGSPTVGGNSSGGSNYSGGSSASYNSNESDSTGEVGTPAEDVYSDEANYVSDGDGSTYPVESNYSDGTNAYEENYTMPDIDANSFFDEIKPMSADESYNLNEDSLFNEIDSFDGTIEQNTPVESAIVDGIDSLGGSNASYPSFEGGATSEINYFGGNNSPYASFRSDFTGGSNDPSLTGSGMSYFGGSNSPYASSGSEMSYFGGINSLNGTGFYGGMNDTHYSGSSDVYVTDGLASARETVKDTYFTKPYSDSKTSLIDAANGFVENQVDGFKDVNTLIQTTAEDPGLVADAFKYAVKNTLFGSSEYKAVPNNKPKITIDGYKAIRNK